jgi:hypothetical protein
VRVTAPDAGVDRDWAAVRALIDPDSPQKARIGHFSTGIEQRPDAPDKLRRGSFADGYASYR